MKDDLTEKQRALVDTIVATGCSITEAAKGLRAPDKVSHNIQGDIKINIDLT